MNVKKTLATVTTRIILIAAIMTSVASSRAVAANGQAELLREDYVIAGADGKLFEAGHDKWMFEFETGTGEAGAGGLKAGQSLELVKSVTLEKLVADAKTRVDARYRLWGKVTKFEGKNYIFATYFLALRKADRPESKQIGPDKNRQAVNAPNDILNIPEEIASRLQTSEVMPATQGQEPLQLKQDAIFANRTGRIVEKQGQYVFEPDGLGQGIEKLSLALLPCQKLDETLGQVRNEPNPVRFNVAGILTTYKGQQYLLLQKATRVYSYGNFGG
jgi:hypothetical protein